MSTKSTKNYVSILVIALLSGSFLAACSSEPETVVAKSSPEFDVADSPAYNFEITPPNEQERIDDIAQKTVLLQQKRADKIETQIGVLRGVHPKSHGCVVADLSINQNIASNLQVGLFSNPGNRYKALVRFSNASVQISADVEDGKNGSRGMAIKVFDVNGDVLIADKGNKNQDFLMINTPSFAFPNVRSYQRLTNALLDSEDGTSPDGAFRPSTDWSDEDFLNIEKTRKVLQQIAIKTVRNPLEVQYFAAAPSSFGSNRVMKFSAEPCSGEKEQESFDDPSLGISTENYLHNALAFTMSKKENVCFDLKIQVISAEQVTAHRDRIKGTREGDLIEDASLVWNEEEIPFTKVAKLILRGPQNIDLLNDEQKACEVRNPLEVQYFAAAPSSFGNNRVMKFSAEPCAGEIQQESFDDPSLGIATDNYLHDALAFTMSKKENVCFDLKIQVISAEQVTAHRDRIKGTREGDLIEDASLVWNEEEIPFTKVAKLILRGPQNIDLLNDEQKACESQAFNPWHSLVQHKPLGGINRLRKPVYVSSAAHRQKQ